MPHGHAVSLGTQQVVGKENTDFRELGLGERVPLPESFRQHGREAADEIVEAARRIQNIIGEKCPDPGRVVPAD